MFHRESRVPEEQRSPRGADKRLVPSFHCDVPCVLPRLYTGTVTRPPLPQTGSLRHPGILSQSYTNLRTQMHRPPTQAFMQTPGSCQPDNIPDPQQIQI